MFFRILKRLAAAAVIAIAPLTASAITVGEASTLTLAPSGSSYEVNHGSELSFIAIELNFFGGTTGPTSFVYEFTTTSPQPLVASISDSSAFGFLSSPVLPSFSFSGGLVGASSPSFLTVTFGDTVFGEVFTFDVAFAAIPLPAGAALLLTGLGGFALLRRRQTGAVAV